MFYQLCSVFSHVLYCSNAVMRLQGYFCVNLAVLSGAPAVRMKTSIGSITCLTVSPWERHSSSEMAACRSTTGAFYLHYTLLALTKSTRNIK